MTLFLNPFSFILKTLNIYKQNVLHFKFPCLVDANSSVTFLQCYIPNGSSLWIIKKLYILNVIEIKLG